MRNNMHHTFSSEAEQLGAFFFLNLFFIYIFLLGAFVAVLAACLLCVFS